MRRKQWIAKKRAKYQRQKLNRRLDHELNPEELKERLERRELIGKETREIMEKALKERHARMLFVKFVGQKFPETVEEIMALDPLIKSVHVSAGFSKGVLDPKKYPNTTGGKYPDARIYMESEEAAETVKKNLEKKKFNGEEMVVSYSGEKAGRTVKELKDTNVLEDRRLRIFGLIPEIDSAMIRKMFPRACHVQKAKKGRPSAVVHFSTIDDARAAFHAAQNLQVGPFALDVNFATVDNEAKIANRKRVEQKRNARIDYAKKKRLEYREQMIKRNLGEDSEDEVESPRKKKKTEDDPKDEDGSDAENDDGDSGDDYENDDSDDE